MAGSARTSASLQGLIIWVKALQELKNFPKEPGYFGRARFFGGPVFCFQARKNSGSGPN